MLEQVLRLRCHGKRLHFLQSGFNSRESSISGLISADSPLRRQKSIRPIGFAHRRRSRSDRHLLDLASSINFRATSSPSGTATAELTDIPCRARYFATSSTCRRHDTSTSVSQNSRNRHELRPVQQRRRILNSPLRFAAFLPADDDVFSLWSIYSRRNDQHGSPGSLHCDAGFNERQTSSCIRSCPTINRSADRSSETI
jgi:hypothetical protein